MPLVLAVFGLAFAFVLAGCDSGSSTTGTVQRTVTFNANGGNFGGSITYAVEVLSGQTLTLPTTTPTKSGYTFRAWYTTSAATTAFNVAGAITTDITVYAGWNLTTIEVPPGSFQVTFNTGGGSHINPLAVADGENVARPQPNPTKSGYTFEGWYTDDTFTTAFVFETMTITDDTSIYARWEAILHTVTFNTHGGSAVQYQTVQDGGTATMPLQDPTRANHTFVNWFTAATDGEMFNFGTVINSDTTIHARWQPVGGNGNGGIPPLTWTAIDIVGTEGQGVFHHTNDITGIAYGNGRFVAVSTLGSMAHSLDGINWTAILPGTGAGQSGFVSTIRDIAYGNGRFVAVGNSGQMARSADGITWTRIYAGTGAGQSSFPNNLHINSIAYGNGRFVAVGQIGLMAHSPDGINWTRIWGGTEAEQSGFPTNQTIFDIAYGGGRFVAVGTGGRMARSADGITWTAILPGTGAEQSTFANNVSVTISAIAYGNGRFVAGVGSGVTATPAGRMAHSPDSINWTAIDAGTETGQSGFPSTQGISAIAYGNGKWVAVGVQGRMAHSPDGINWTTILPGTGAGQSAFTTHISAITYGNGRFVAGGTGGRVAVWRFE